MAELMSGINSAMCVLYKMCMSLFEIHKYTAADKEAWNAFVAESKNGTFLFDRNYMDYHHDRFDDNSLMFYAKDKLYAILSANRSGDCLCSHGGLTYGGLVMTNKATAAEVLVLFEELNAYLRGTGIAKVRYHGYTTMCQLKRTFMLCSKHVMPSSWGATSHQASL